MSKFKDFWIKKSHDISIQNDLNDVKDGVHELDEKVDQYEDAQGNLKPGVHVDKGAGYEWRVEENYKGFEIMREYEGGKPVVNSSYTVNDDSIAGSFITIQSAKKYIDSFLMEKNTVHITYDRNGVPVNSYVDEDKETKKDFTIVGDPNSPNANHGKLLEWVNSHGTPADRKVFSNLDNESHRAQYERMAAQDKKKGMFPNFQVSKDEADEISDEDLEAAGEYYDRVVGSKKAMGTGFAGAIPNSVLARQDLEGKNKSSSKRADSLKVGDSVAGEGIVERVTVDNNTVKVTYDNGRSFNLDADDDVYLDKSIADDSSLYQLKDDARDSDTKEEKEELSDKIKETQVKRQKATLKDRGVTKSFKQVWNILNLHD